MSLFPVFLLFLLFPLQIDAIFMAYPLHRPWRQHLCGGFHSETSQDVTLAAKPAIKGCVTHSGSFCQLVFVCAFHTTKLRNFSDFCKKIFANLFTSFQKFSMAFEKVVPLQYES